MNFKKYVVFLVGIACLFVYFTVGTNAENKPLFSDVDENYENFNAIYFLYSTGVIDGYVTDGSDVREYRPEQKINRAEFLKLLLKDAVDSLENSIKEEYSKSCFSDVPVDLWYAPYVCYAKEKGVVQGYPDMTFRPESAINEVEALKMFGKIFEWEIGTAINGKEWYKPYLDYAVSKKFITSRDTNNENIDTLMNRGDIAEIIFRNVQVFFLGLENYDDNYIDELFSSFGIGEGWINEGLSGDSPVEGSGETVVSGSVVPKITISSDRSSVAAGESLILTIGITDKDGKPLGDRTVSVEASTGIDYSKNLPVEEFSPGFYKASFSSQLAGEFTLHVTDEKSGGTETMEITVTPGVLDHVEITDIIYPYENDVHNQAIISFTGKDKYENVLLYSSVNNNLNVTTSLGSAFVSHNDNGVFTAKITADDWGIANVSIIDKKSSTVISEGDVEIFFFPVQLDMPKGISASEKQISVPIYLYFPAKYGYPGCYKFDIHYDPESLEFADVSDLDAGDSFGTPNVVVDTENGVIHLSQINENPNLPVSQDIGIGKLLFNVPSVGGGTIYVDSVVVTNKDGEEQGYLAKFAGLIGETIESATQIIESADKAIENAEKALVDATIAAAKAEKDAIIEELSGVYRWIFNIKGTKDVCIDAFIFPGSGASNGDVTTDVAYVNAIFTKIAKSCNCKYYLNFILHSVIALTAADWAAVDANGDGDVDVIEIGTQVNNHPATGSCVPVYYPPAITARYAGWSWEGATEGIDIDNSKDNDNRTLAHELAHQLSQGEVKDPNNPPVSGTQGADTAGNLMNYNNTGDTLTKMQCELIEKYLK